jgi:hypothetical protein
VGKAVVAADVTTKNYFVPLKTMDADEGNTTGRDIPFVKDVKFLGVIFDRKITWRYNAETTAAKALQTFIRIYPLLISERLSAKSKLTLYKASIK